MSAFPRVIYVAPPKIDGPLVFGNAEQIKEIKRYQQQLEQPEDPSMDCFECDGEGSVICRECDGSGQTRQKVVGL